MKKFLTVLLVIAVMFTFSFGSAFAYDATQLQKVVDTHEAAVKAIQDKYDDNLAALNLDLSNKLAAKPADVAASAWTTACNEALEAAKANLNKELAEAWNALAAAEAAVEEIKGWDLGTGALEPGYVDVAPALAKLATVSVGTPDSAKAEFDVAMAKTLELIKNYDLTKFAQDDNYNKTGKSSYQHAVKAQSDALALLATYKYTDGKTAADVKAVYEVVGAGTLGEAESGSFYNAIKNLTTVASLTTDAAKIEYAKAQYIAKAEAAMAAAKAAELKVQNDIIFAQSVATKPNQKTIDAANEEIAKINEKYAALEEVWGYRLANAEYVIKAGVVSATYDEATLATVGTFDANNVFTVGNFTVTAGVIADSVAIAEKVAELKDEAEVLKATIYVDGDVALDVDAALEDAIEETYMTGVKADLETVLTNAAVHARAHQLLGTDCAGTAKTAKVTVAGKKYDNLGQWATTGYSKENTKAVKAIIKDAKAAVKAAATVEEAEAAFLAAYAEYDEVLTVAEQQALFAYNGPLYKQDAAAKAELDAYINYKVALMDDAVAGVAAKLTGYYTIAKLTEEVNNAEDLVAAVAEAKAFVDGLKTETELKAADKALRAEIVAVARPVAVAAKAEIVALYEEYVDFNDYCTIVGYNNTESDAVVALLTTDLARLADMEEKAVNDLFKAIEKDGKVTLADKENVAALEAAVDAYNDLYVDDLETETVKLTTKGYEDQIFALEVAAAEKLIYALPSPITADDLDELVAARAAVEALGFAGKCEIRNAAMTKLNKLEQDAEELMVQSVETLKITAKSSAKKGSITVKWTVKGDTSAVEGYEIWKSTKHSSGYKKAFTTTKMSYKNTKGLKKGTRYYYKVRAIAFVDGEKVTSDWSNKARRIAK